MSNARLLRSRHVLAAAVSGLIAPLGAADIILADEGYNDRNDNPTTWQFSIYNNFGLQANGGSTVAEVGVVNPITGTVGDAFSGNRSLTMFAVDDNVFTGSGELFELIIGPEGQASVVPNYTSTGESTTAERDMSQFDDTGTMTMSFAYRVADLSFVPGRDGGGPLPEALEVEVFELSFTDSDSNPVVPGDQPTVDRIAAALGVNASNPLLLTADDQWHVVEVPMGVLSASQRDSANAGGGFSEDIATSFTIGLNNLGDADINRGIAYEVFIDDIRILTEGDAITGDYDSSGQVEQGDLDIVLQNWGTGTFTGDEAALVGGGPFDGTIDQNELDGVLQNWGSTAAPSFDGSAVPEPAALALLGAGGLVAMRRRSAVA